MSKQALIVTDYTVDFVADDGKLTCGKAAQAIEAALAKRIEEAIQKGEDVFVCNDLHEENDPTHPETKLFPPHNIRGTAGRELYGTVKAAVEVGLRVAPKKVHILDKTRYSCFTRTPLHVMLQERGIDTVVITGVCTDICVLHTAVDAYNLGYSIVVPADAVASFNPQGHEWALGHFKNCLGALVL